LGPGWRDWQDHYTLFFPSKMQKLQIGRKEWEMANQLTSLLAAEEL